MENLNILLGQDEAFDAFVHGRGNGHLSLKQASAVTVVTKDAATVSGRPGAVIAFEVQLPDGRTATAQATVTVALLAAMGSALRGRYGPGGPQGNRYPPEDNPFPS